MDKISRLFLNQVQVLQKQLENLLEKEPLTEKDRIEKKPFYPQTDLSQLENLSIGLPQYLRDRAVMIFSRIAPYFDSGLLFMETQGQWKAICGFDQGEFFPLKGVEIEIPFRFPDMSLVEVRRVQSPEIFSQLMDLQVIRSERGQALIFKPQPEFIFMVTSTLGDPWLKPHIEKIQKEVLLLLGDY
jgi:hypothetical protein